MFQVDSCTIIQKKNSSNVYVPLPPPLPMLNALILFTLSRSQSALYTHTFPFKHAQPRDDESFSVEQRGRLSVYEAGKMGEAVAAMEAAVQ